jgi:hypothetical protein
MDVDSKHVPFLTTYMFHLAIPSIHAAERTEIMPKMPAARSVLVLIYSRQMSISSFRTTATATSGSSTLSALTPTQSKVQSTSN